MLRGGYLWIGRGVMVVQGHARPSRSPVDISSGLLWSSERVFEAVLYIGEKSRVTDVNSADSVFETMTFRGSNPLLYLP